MLWMIFQFKFTLSKAVLKMLCHIVLIAKIHRVTNMISTHCGVSGCLNDEVSWFFSPLPLSKLYEADQKKNLSPIYYQKKYALMKVLQENKQFAIPETKFLTNFLLTTVTISLLVTESF